MNFQNIFTFTYQKTFTYTFLLLVFKIVESLHCIFKRGRKPSAFKRGILSDTLKLRL